MIIVGLAGGALAMVIGGNLGLAESQNAQFLGRHSTMLPSLFRLLTLLCDGCGFKIRWVYCRLLTLAKKKKKK